MIKHLRQSRILGILRTEGTVELSSLQRLIPGVSLVTLRRDLSELAEAGALKRTHGGAVLPDADILRLPSRRPHLVASEDMGSGLEGMDGIILPPISGRGAEALRRRVARSGAPFLAESAAQDGGVYLGPDNAAAGHALGEAAGRAAAERPAVVLMICQMDLPNTRARSDGFEAGFTAAHGGSVEFIRVNGQGSYRQSLRVTLDALRTRDDISVVFGVNDHSALAGIDAAEQVGVTVSIYAAGGENPDFVGRLAERGPLCAVAAFFPGVVGTMAIDVMARAAETGTLPESLITPYVIIDPENLADYYHQTATGGWALMEHRQAALVGPASPHPIGRRYQIGFMPHYPAHDWYRIMIQAMTARAAEYGITFNVSPPHKGIAEEIVRLRSEIAQTAADRIEPGQTVILGQGEATRLLAEEIARRAIEMPAHWAGVTVITNALDILDRLASCDGLKVILTSGEFQKADRCLVGPSLGALFERMRADLAFLSVSGVSAEFGLSAVDERLALANSRLVDAARRTVALADHTLIGVDCNHRIARPERVHDVITDDGAIPADRQRLRAVGIDVLIAGEATDDLPQGPEARGATARST
ncbi:MAG: substrate-binding domain-containing protein [Pseudomonadota bacterium]